MLDRSFIAKTLSEQEFSASDLTSGDSAKLAAIGGFLKASYIVVSTVQKLDTRFFLSAKMIEVKSGVIMAQTSVDRDGSISVLIDMAGELGRKLVAASMGQEAPKPSGRASAQPAQSAPPAQTAPPARVARQPREPRPSGARFSTVAGEFGAGSTNATVLGNSYDFDLYTGSYTSFEAVTGTAYGASVIIPKELFYISAGLTITDTEYLGIGYTTDTESIYGSLGLGINMPIGPVLSYVGLRGSYMSFDWVEDGSLYNEGTWTGLCYGLEVGGDYRLGMFGIGVRYTLDMGTLTDPTETWVDLDIVSGALSLRLGIAF